MRPYALRYRKRNAVALGDFEAMAKTTVSMNTKRYGTVIATGAVAFSATLLLPAASFAIGPAPASTVLGQALFQERCASCHGADGKGGGPDAATLSVQPPDLTTLAQRAGGTFPAPRIVEIITYGGNIAAHGTGPMPIWGKIFSDEGGRGRIGAATSRQNVVALKRYLETIQK